MSLTCKVNSTSSQLTVSDLDITPPRKIAKINKHRQQKFRDAWLKNEDYKQWLSNVPENQYKAKCRTCNVIMNAELTVIKNHMKSKIHLRKYLAAQQSISTFMKKTDEIGTKAKATQALEIKLCGFLAEHNISSTTLNHLTTLLQSSVPDSEIINKMQMKSTKATAIIKNVIAEAEKEYLQKKLQINRFSVLIDVSTDIGGIQTMCIIVRFFDEEEGRVVSKFWHLCQIFEQNSEVESATAEYLFGLVVKSFEDYEIPSENIIGLASDGGSPMMGKDNSVASRFPEKCPGIYIFKCICHSSSLDLCASSAYPVLKLVSNLNPSKAMLRETRDIVPSLLPLMKALPRIAPSNQHQIIDDEWRQLPSFELPEGIDVNDPVDIFWAKLLELEEGDQGMTFKNISKFVLEVISLPHSNADSERIFSQVNLVKTKARNKMTVSTVNGVLLAKQRVRGKGNDCTTYDPSQSEYSRMNKALRTL
ncbi:uncharacterized protein LOC123691815 [Colias croceus]|uniref:uncharacterized protein LOC123691815 n=1 Tax=Colias crocea TaxID=72248 RepID=UPI001E27B29E|nr:uncharacterized protein LOC123691815 [Colias croceus]XP_045492340.1 uncharacterized protein LOC123691815 [Colias croceus]